MPACWSGPCKRIDYFSVLLLLFCSIGSIVMQNILIFYRGKSFSLLVLFAFIFGLCFLLTYNVLVHFGCNLANLEEDKLKPIKSWVVRAHPRLHFFFSKVKIKVSQLEKVFYTSFNVMPLLLSHLIAFRIKKEAIFRVF